MQKIVNIETKKANVYAYVVTTEERTVALIDFGKNAYYYQGPQMELEHAVERTCEKIRNASRIVAFVYHPEIVDKTKINPKQHELVLAEKIYSQSALINLNLTEMVAKQGGYLNQEHNLVPIKMEL